MEDFVCRFLRSPFNPWRLKPVRWDLLVPALLFRAPRSLRRQDFKLAASQRVNHGLTVNKTNGVKTK